MRQRSPFFVLSLTGTTTTLTLLFFVLLHSSAFSVFYCNTVDKIDLLVYLTWKPRLLDFQENTFFLRYNGWKLLDRWGNMWLSFCKENRELKKPLSFLCKTRSRKECFSYTEQAQAHRVKKETKKKLWVFCLCHAFQILLVARCVLQKSCSSFIVLPFVGFFVKTASCIIFLHTLPIFDTSSNKNTKNFFISNYHGTFFEEP